MGATRGARVAVFGEKSVLQSELNGALRAGLASDLPAVTPMDGISPRGIGPALDSGPRLPSWQGELPAGNYSSQFPEVTQSQRWLSADEMLTRQILNGSSSKAWGSLADGTNQGAKHFVDYWSLYPDRIPSLETRLGVDAGTFDKTVEGFDAFTSQAQQVVENGQVRVIDDSKSIYYQAGAANPNKGVVVIVKDGRIQSMMASDPKSFGKMK